jgi:hypothetical protein
MTAVIKLVTIFCIFLFTLLGCAPATDPSVGNATYAAHETYLQKLRAEYVSQFVAAANPHATLIGYPYQGYDVFKPSAFVPSRIDKTSVQSLYELKGKFEHPLQPWSRPQYGYALADQTLLSLRIKAGQYDIETWGGGYTGKRTLFKDVQIKSGIAYMIYPKLIDGKRMLSINEFSVDSRFTPFEREYYIVGKAVSQAVEWGRYEDK